jgi:hypothetical protein
VQVWISLLSGSDTHHVTEQAHDARRMCGLLGIDDATIQEQAEKEIPTPKSWAALEPDSKNATLNGSRVAADQSSSSSEEPPFDPSPSKATRPPKGFGKRGKHSSATRARRKPPTRRR